MMSNSPIEEYIKEQDFYKNDTPDDLRDVFSELINKGFNENEALKLIRIIVSAIKNEYGE